MSSRKANKIECLKTRISYDDDEDIIKIQHFDEDDRLLSELNIDYEGAYYYARLITEVADYCLEVE